MHISARPGVRLVACLALAGALSCRSREEAQPPVARATDLSASIAGPPASENQGDPRIVFLGDSLTAGLGLATNEAYPAVLQERLRAKGLDYQVINFGVSGDTSAGGLSRLDWALEGDVYVLVIALGANDGLRGLPVSQLKNNLARVIERAQAQGIAVVLAGMEAPPNWGDMYTRAFRDVYPSLANEYQVALVPFLLEGVAGVDRLNQRDGIHPTAEGDRIVADTVWKVLEPIIAAGARQPIRTGSSGS